jgi:hypothetical protein
LYINRQQLIESAIRDKIEELKFVKTGETTSFRRESKVNEMMGEGENNLLVRIKETLLLHTAISMANGEMPDSNLDLRLFEQKIKSYIKGRAEGEDRKITEKQLDDLSQNLLQYYKELLKGLGFQPKSP